MDNILDLTTSFSQSINENAQSILSEVAEIGIDSILDEGLLKEIPLVSTVISLYKIGTNIHERHYLKKLYVFIEEINNHTANDEEREFYKERIKSRPNKELEYILILIDRYLDYYKPRILAALYMSYLDYKISRDLFTEYAEIIDRLLMSDFVSLCEFMFHGGINSEEKKNDIASVLRLQSVGLVENIGGIPVTIVGGNETAGPSAAFDYKTTDFGKCFISLLNKELREIYESQKF